MGDVILGIDLGTTNSCVGIWHDGEVKILRDAEGNYLTPSCVSYVSDKILVGQSANRQLLINPNNTIYDIKRVIGKPSIDEIIEKSKKYWTFKIVQDKELKPAVEIKQNEKTKLIYPEEVSAKVLQKMKEIAECFLSTPVKKAIITVPAYFNQAQKAATIKAAELSGLEVPELITEPAAAAYAYGFDQTDLSNCNLLVVDLGGGTFDVVVVQVNNKKLEILSIGGDSNLGGRDFDTLLMGYFRNLIKKNYGKDCFENKSTQQKLRNECINIKHELTDSTEASLFLGELFPNFTEVVTINRDSFNNICQSQFDQIEQIINETLGDAGIQKSEIHEILMIGGSSRIPQISVIMNKIFPKKKLNHELNPDEAVAYGAAIFGAQRNKSANASQGLILGEAVPLAIGTGLAGGIFGVVIPKNSRYPIEKTVQRATIANNQTTMHIKVYEGIRKFLHDNIYLGCLKLEGITLGPAGSQVVDVTFKLDSNGILNVKAKHKDKQAELMLDYKNDFKTPDNLEFLLSEPSLRGKAEEEAVKKIKAQTKFKIQLQNIRYELENENMTKEQKENIEAQCKIMDNWLNDNPLATENDYNKKIDELKNIISK